MALMARGLLSLTGDLSVVQALGQEVTTHRLAPPRARPWLICPSISHPATSPSFSFEIQSLTLLVLCPQVAPHAALLEPLVHALAFGAGAAAVVRWVQVGRAGCRGSFFPRATA